MSTESTQVTSQESTDAGVQAATTDTLLTDTPAEGTTAPVESEAKADEAATEVTAPESYEFAMPEGVELDEKAAAEFSDIAKELKLPQDQAQKIVDMYAKRVQGQVEAHKALVEGWASTVKADKEIGGDKLPESLATARKAVDTFGSPELKSLLNTSGLGNHPEFVKLMYRAGKAISEDRFIVGGETGAVNTDIAKSLYPNQP
jgi:hypothetical protein